VAISFLDNFHLFYLAACNSYYPNEIVPTAAHAAAITTFTRAAEQYPGRGF
jgi:hypothetical protein